MIVADWLAPDGFLSFYHKWNDEHGKPFPDSIHHTSFWLMLKLITGEFSVKEVRAILVKGFASRWDGKQYLKYPGSNERASSDNLKFMVPLLYHVGEKGLADDLLKNYMGYTRWLPQWRDVFFGRRSFLGCIFEAADAVTDWFSDSYSSQIKNVGRYIWLGFKGVKKKEAVALFNARVMPYRALEIYFSRGPSTPSSEFKALPMLPSADTPPPIYLGYDKLIKRYMK